LMHSSSKRITSRIAILFLGATITVGAIDFTSYSLPAAEATENSDKCELIEKNLDFSSEPDSERNQQFNEYGDTSDGWSGGDSTYSVDLQDDKVLWAFSDTFLGPADEDGGRSQDSPYINNSFVLDDGKNLTTVHGGSEKEPDSLLPPTNDDNWFWIGDGNQTDEEIQLLALQFESDSDEMWDFDWIGNHLAIFDSQSYELQDMVDLPSD